jgi:uncharacterized protein YheU (UPF0270 family)
MNVEYEQTYVLIPPERLSHQAFESLLEEYILREGTDYGMVELSLKAKRDRALKQIESGFVKIVYSPENNSCTILKATELGLKV